MMTMRIVVFCVVGAGCVPPAARPDHPTDHAPPLVAHAEQVEIVGSDPDRSLYEFVDDVQGEATSPDIAVATREARNNLKANAEGLGAQRVVLDMSNGVPKFLQGYRIVLNGRAFRRKVPGR